MNIQIKLLSPQAKIPTRGSDFAAGYDLYTTESYELRPGERHLYKTGLSTSMPIGIYGRIAPRSGLAYKNGIDTMAGVIDSDYRGEIGVILVNLGQENVKFPIIKDGKETPIAQIIFETHHEVDFESVDVLAESKRNTGGFGHSDTIKKVEPAPTSNLLEKWKTSENHVTAPKYETIVREREKSIG